MAKTATKKVVRKRRERKNVEKGGCHVGGTGALGAALGRLRPGG